MIEFPVCCQVKDKTLRQEASLAIQARCKQAHEKWVAHCQKILAFSDWIKIANQKVLKEAPDEELQKGWTAADQLAGVHLFVELN